MYDYAYIKRLGGTYSYHFPIENLSNKVLNILEKIFKLDFFENEATYEQILFHVFDLFFYVESSLF